MSDLELIRIVDFAIHVGPCAAILLIGLAVLPFPLGPILSAAACGAIAILFVARELNRRYDPRQQKPPTDAP